jgi:hypothetical protein
MTPTLLLTRAGAVHSRPPWRRFPRSPTAPSVVSIVCAVVHLPAKSCNTVFLFPKPVTTSAGMTCGALSDFPDGIYPADSCVARVVTPHVAAVSRAFFGCPSLPGAELENHNPGCQIVGSHWEQRVFNSEVSSYFEIGNRVASVLICVIIATLSVFSVCGRTAAHGFLRCPFATFVACYSGVA